MTVPIAPIAPRRFLIRKNFGTSISGYGVLWPDSQVTYRRTDLKRETSADWLDFYNTFVAGGQDKLIWIDTNNELDAITPGLDMSQDDGQPWPSDLPLSDEEEPDELPDEANTVISPGPCQCTSCLRREKNTLQTRIDSLTREVNDYNAKIFTTAIIDDFKKSVGVS